MFCSSYNWLRTVLLILDLQWEVIGKSRRDYILIYVGNLHEI